MTDILISGGDGVLASAFSEKYDCYTPSKNEMDVTDIDSIIENITPDVKYFIHTAAITSVERCETDKKTAYNVNVQGTRNVINALKKKCIKLIHISTPCVFDGHNAPYMENDIPQPENYYGLTKLIAEEFVLSSGLPYLLIRTNFVSREPWPYPKAFTDRYGNYLYADQVADLIFLKKNQLGIRHIHGLHTMSMFELALSVSSNVEPMTMDDYNGKAKLTMNMELGSLYD